MFPDDGQDVDQVDDALADSINAYSQDESGDSSNIYLLSVRTNNEVIEPVFRTREGQGRY